MTALGPRETLRARLAAMRAAPARGGDVSGALCAVALVCMTFAASGASYTPVVDFNMAHRLNSGLTRDPLAIVGTIGAVLSTLITVLGLAQNRVRPTLVAIASIAFCAYSTLSIAWGVFSVSAIGEGLKGITYVIAMPYCIAVLGPRRAAACVLFTLMAILVGSALLCVVDKRFATDGYAVVHYEWRSASDVLGWRGLFTQKNWLAMSCLSTLLFQLFTFRQFRRSLAFWLLILLTLVLLYKSRGKTAELVSAIVLGAVAALFINRRVFKIDLKVIAFLGAGLTLALLYGVSTGLILQHFDWTFTHRTIIWQEYWKLSTQRPWFGYGSGGAWQEDEIFGELRQNAAGMTSAHNSYLAMLFSGGFTALSLFALWLLAVLREVFVGMADWNSRVVAVFAIIAGLMLAMFEAMFSPNIAVSFAAYILFFGITYMRATSPAPPPRTLMRARLRPAPRLRRPSVATPATPQRP